MSEFVGQITMVRYNMFILDSDVTLYLQTGETTPGTTGYFEVSVNNELVHSKKVVSFYNIHHLQAAAPPPPPPPPHPFSLIPGKLISFLSTPRILNQITKPNAKVRRSANPGVTIDLSTVKIYNDKWLAL